ncbi:ribonuclease H-like domain-containing protein [Tanacetum coccineum]
MTGSVKSDNTCTVSNNQGNTTNELLVNLLGQLSITGSGWNNTSHVAYHTNVNRTSFLPGLVQQHIYFPACPSSGPPGFIQNLVRPACCYPSVGPSGFVQHQAQPVTQLGQFTYSPRGPLSQAQPTGTIDQTVHTGSTGLTVIPGQKTTLPHAFTVKTLHDPATSGWNMDTGASSHLNNSITSLSENFNTCMYPSISFIRDNNCTIEFDAFGFSVKNFMTRQHTWHQRLGHPGSEVLRRLVSNNFISCNKEKPPVLCHACQLRKHVRLPFVSSSTVISSCFDIIHSGGTNTAYLLLYADDIVLTASSESLLAHMDNYNPSRTPIDTESKLGSDGDSVSDPTLYQF